MELVADQEAGLPTEIACREDQRRKGTVVGLGERIWGEGSVTAIAAKISTDWVQSADPAPGEREMQLPLAPSFETCTTLRGLDLG